jgi:hypothetical protein
VVFCTRVQRLYAGLHAGASRRLLQRHRSALLVAGTDLGTCVCTAAHRSVSGAALFRTRAGDLRCTD